VERADVDWRREEDYPELDDSALAWEFLRRNADYRAAVAAGQDVGRWGLVTAIDPNTLGADARPLWRWAVAPAWVVRLADAPTRRPATLAATPFPHGASPPPRASATRTPKGSICAFATVSRLCWRRARSGPKPSRRFFRSTGTSWPGLRRRVWSEPV
jgi:hypothetical protein